MHSMLQIILWALLSLHSTHFDKLHVYLVKIFFNIRKEGKLCLKLCSYKYNPQHTHTNKSLLHLGSKKQSQFLVKGQDSQLKKPTGSKLGWWAMRQFSLTLPCSTKARFNKEASGTDNLSVSTSLWAWHNSSLLFEGWVFPFACIL